jgi:hypothetical protein
MADPFAPTPSRLDLAYQFAARDRVRDELRELMSALEARFQAIEQGPAKTYAQELSALQQNARNAVTDALTPFYEDLSEIASLGGIFLATSASLVTIGLGPKTFVVAGDAVRTRFAPTAYMAAYDPASPDRILLGEVTQYNRTTGELTINVQSISDTFTVGQTQSAWSLVPSPPPHVPTTLDAGTFGGMAPIATRSPVQLRRSNIATDAPTAAQLLDGELALNFRDANLFWRNQAGAVQAHKLFVGDIGDVALRGDADQYATWTHARRNQAMRNLRRALTYLTANATVDPALDMARPFIHDSTTDHTLTLPTLAAAGDGFRFKLKTLNTSGRGGIVTLVRQGAETIDGANANFLVPCGQSIEVIADAAIGWRVFGFSRAPMIYRIDQLTSGVGQIIVPLARGYSRYMVRGQRLPKANNSNANLQLTASVDVGASYLGAYHRVFADNSSATAWAVAGLLNASNVNIGINHGSPSVSAFFNMEVGPGGNANDAPCVSGDAFTYNTGYGPTRTIFSASAPGVAPSAFDTLKIFWSDGDDITGTVLVTGIL